MIEQVSAYNQGCDVNKLQSAFEILKKTTELNYENNEIFDESISLVEKLIPLKADDDLIVAALLNQIYVDGFVSSDQVQKNLVIRFCYYLII